MHKTLKESNIEALCNSIVDIAQRHPALLPEVTATSLQFKKLLKLFGQCHGIYDRLFLDDNAIHKLM